MRDGLAWWKAESGEVHSKVLEYVEEVERAQSGLFQRLAQCAYLYDPNDPSASDLEPSREAGISQNVCASNVDAAYAAIAAAEVRARFMTDGGDWAQQRQARHLEWYAAGLAKLLDLHGLTRVGFNDSAKKGTGLVKVYADHECGEICAERVMVDDIVVDQSECRAGGQPRQMHQRVLVDKDELVARFPDHETEIRACQEGSYANRRAWAGYRELDRNEIVVVESWRLPCGNAPGRHTICIDGHDIEDDREWQGPFPFARIVWSERTTGWYGIGLIERIAPTQRVVNRYNWLEEAWIRRHAIPTTWVRPADVAMTVKSQGVLGNMGVYKGDMPQTIWPQAVSPEVSARRREAVESAYEETGMSRLAATSRKPPGLESGVALREYRDQTTQRFSQQEKAFERFYLDLVLLALSCAKELGDQAPVISHRGSRTYKRIKWNKVDPGDLRVQIQAASDLPRTPAGRQQLALELAQAGVISTDSAIETMTDLDIDAELSLYKAAAENIDRVLDDIVDEEDSAALGLVPEGYDNLQLAKWRSQQRYLKERADSCPEEILEGIRQYNQQAIALLEMAAAPAPGMAPGAAPAGAMPPPGPEMAASQPVAALAPQAMDLVAG